MMRGPTGRKDAPLGGGAAPDEEAQDREKDDMRHSGHAATPGEAAPAATMETAAYSSPRPASARPPWGRRAPVLLSALLLALSLGLAPMPAAAASFLERAQQYFAEGDLRSAAVELKTPP